MLLGPILTTEFVGASRRRRYYVGRSLYAILLLGVLWLNYQIIYQWHMAPTHAQMAEMTKAFFEWLAILQMGAIVLLAPAMLAGAVAGERERRTMDDLLTSELSAGDIVLGKLIGSMTRLTALLVSGFGLLMIARMLGGIEFVTLLRVFVSTASVMLSVCGLSILVSTWSRRARDALRMIYGALFILVVLPAAIAITAFAVGLGVNWRPIVFVMNTLNPVNVLGSVIPAPVASPAIWVTWLCQALFGCACVAASILTLRRACRRLNEAPAPGRAMLKTMGRSTRSPMGDHPMWWKERGARRPAIHVLLVVTAILAGVLLLNLMQAWTWNKDDTLGGITGVATIALCAAVLLANARCAMSVTGEKERQCWDTLLSTDLTSREIVLAKVAGGIYAVRHFLLFVVCLWVVAAFYDRRALVPLLLQPATFVVICSFAAAIGLWFSFGSQASTTAALKSLVFMLVVGGGYLFLVAPICSIAGWNGEESLFAFLGVVPFHLAFSGMSFLWNWPPTSRETIYIVVTCTLGIAGYAAAGPLLVMWCVECFDRWVGRVGLHAFDE